MDGGAPSIQNVVWRDCLIGGGFEGTGNKIAESLLLHGADVNSINKDKVTPLMYSATNGFRTMTALLIKNEPVSTGLARKG